MVSYITGKKLHDDYYHKTWYNYKHKSDVLFYKIMLPNDSPSEFYNLQNLCYEMDKAEKRRDARTARDIVGSLPNELPTEELIVIVEEFVKNYFVKYGFGAIVAIHEGKNEKHPSKNNPHVHIIITTRSIDSTRFCSKKDREWNKKKYVSIWREEWAKVQNNAYKRNQIKAKVSPYSLKAQGRKYKALPYLSLADYQKEKRGIHTDVGDKRRKIKKYNKKLDKEHRQEKQHNKEYEFEM